MGVAGYLFPPAIRRAAGVNLRSEAGRAANASGKEFEKLILQSQRDERGQIVKLCQIKNYAKRIPFGKDRPGCQLVEERSQFDFAGAVVDSGRGIFFDAKSAGPGHAGLRVNDPKIVKPHQINELEDLEKAGAIAGFLVRCFSDRVYLWLPASKARSPKPIRWDDSRFVKLGPIWEGYGVPLRNVIDAYESSGLF